MFKCVNKDCLKGMLEMEENSVDSIVTDPPYGLSFMGKDWDHGVPGTAFWKAAIRVAKPGAHLLAFGGTRTFHRLACAVEDAGWEIRDCVMWVYGSGFPKSLNVSKAIDKSAGAEREVVGQYTVSRDLSGGSWADLHGQKNAAKQHNITAPATDAAREWEGWGTALKPAWEPIIVARKPLVGTVVENVLTHGTGAINVDGCRVGAETTVTIRRGNSGVHGRFGRDDRVFSRENPPGRWPANLIHDGSQHVLELFPESNRNSAARFFYCAKTSKRDRDDGAGRRNIHPTVKPTDLMRYLCRLVTPTGGTVLDPFMGSGSTGKAAVLEKFNFIGFDLSYEYCKIATARIEHAERKASL